MIDIRDDDIQQVAGISGSPLGLWEVAETDEDYGMFIIGERKKENNILALWGFPQWEAYGGGPRVECVCG